MSNILTNNINPRSGNKITIGGVNDRVSIAGTLSYEDVTNVDSVGIITGRSGLHVIGAASSVGIGTDDPQAKLEILHVESRRHQFSYDDSILTIKGANQSGNPETLRFIGGDSLRFHTGTTGSGTEKVRITSAGYLGIGTDDPSALVEIEGDDFVKITRNSKELSLNANYSGQDIKAQIQCGAGMSLAFATNGDNERVVIQSGGDTIFHTKIIVGDSHSGGEILKLMKNSGTSYLAHYNGATAHGFLGYASELVTGGSTTDYALRATNNLLFSTNGANERMRIDSDGHIICGTTSLNNYGTVNAYSNDQTPGLRCVSGSSMNTGSAVLAVDKHQNINTTSQTFMIFTINEQNTGSGKITANGASQAAFGTFSDRRLKTNIVDIPSQYENIRRLRPVEFDYIESEGGGHQTSFIAQEFEEVYPEAIGEREDGMKTLTGWGKTEAILVKALQEAMAKIETLEAKVATLEGN